MYEAVLLEEPMSRKERSFSIWGREKLLDEQFSLVREVLRLNGLGEDFLNYYDTLEPFFEYVHSQTPSMSVLVIENKDTWFIFQPFAPLYQLPRGVKCRSRLISEVCRRRLKIRSLYIFVMSVNRWHNSCYLG